MCPKNQSATDVENRLALTSLQTRLLERARKRCGDDIEPCSGKSWEQCFLDHGRYGYALYFNTPDHNTHVEKEEIMSRPLIKDLDLHKLSAADYEHFDRTDGLSEGEEAAALAEIERQIDEQIERSRGEA